MKKDILYAEIKIKVKDRIQIINAVIKDGDTTYKGTPILEIIKSKIVGQTNEPNDTIRTNL